MASRSAAELIVTSGEAAHAGDNGERGHRSGLDERL